MGILVFISDASEVGFADVIFHVHLDLPLSSTPCSVFCYLPGSTLNYPDVLLLVLVRVLLLVTRMVILRFD